jgi:hypothetical protein
MLLIRGSRVQESAREQVIITKVLRGFPLSHQTYTRVESQIGTEPLPYTAFQIRRSLPPSHVMPH